MERLLVVGTASLSTINVGFQSTIAKNGIKQVKDSLFFIVLIFLSASLLFIPYIFNTPLLLWAYAGAYALCNTIFQLSYTLAISKGNVSLSAMFASFGIVIPITLSVLIAGEDIETIRLIGLVVMAFAFVCTLKPNKTGGGGFSLPLAIMCLLANGMGLTVQRVFVVAMPQVNIFSFVSASYLLSAMICGSIVGVLALKGKKPSIITGKAAGAAACSGIALSLHLALNTYQGKVLDASFQFPVNSGLNIIFITTMGILVFKDKLSKRQTLACILGLIAIVLINIR